jgi:hypothetical protein
MASGHDLAIEGPPGTGKSETITNMIANAVAAGKRVLFVAEKQAALRVVADRLRASGLGPLLLELHGDNANRTDVYEGLRHRLKTQASTNPGLLMSQRQQLRQQRDALRRYLALIDQKLGATGHTAYWLVWREVRLRSELDREVVDAAAAAWQPANPASIDRPALSERRARLDQFGAALIAVEREADGAERTAWTRAARLGRFDQRPQLEASAAAAAAAAAVAAAGEALDMLADLGLPAPDGMRAEAAEQLSALAPFDPLPEEIARTALREPDCARALLRQQARWRQLCGKLGEDVSDAASIAPDALEELSTAIAAAAPLDASVAAFREALRRSDEALALAERAVPERERAALSLRLEPSISAGAFRTALEVATDLSREPATVAALYRTDLLDPLAEAAMSAEISRARLLREERQALLQRVHPEALEAEPAELSGIADTLADTGPFARLFSGAYKAAKRRMLRLARTPGSRAETAELLRSVARWLSQTAAFRSGSPIAAWFPAILWQGIDSKCEALLRARTALIEARRRFADIGADEAL